MKTFKNKIVASILITIGFLSIWIDDDITAFVFTLMFGLPLFFEEENIIE